MRDRGPSVHGMLLAGFVALTRMSEAKQKEVFLEIALLKGAAGNAHERNGGRPAWLAMHCTHKLPPNSSSRKIQQRSWTRPFSAHARGRPSGQGGASGLFDRFVKSLSLAGDS